MSGRVVIPDSLSESSDDSIPSPSPFSPEYRRPRPSSPQQQESATSSPAAKRQRLSVLEQPEEDDEILSEPNEERNDGNFNTAQTTKSSKSGVQMWACNVCNQVFPTFDVAYRHEQSCRREKGTVKTESKKKAPSEPRNADKEGKTLSVQHGNGQETSRKSVVVMLEETKTDVESAGQSAPDEDKKPPAKESSPPPVQEQSEEEPFKATSDTSNDDNEPKDEVVSDHVHLQAIPSNLPPLEPVTEAEVALLKKALQFKPNDPDDVWPTEWSGRIDLFTREVPNPLAGEKSKGDDRPLFAWAETSPKNLSLARALIKYVYNEADTPPTAKQILAITYNESIRVPGYDMEPAMRRLSFDPAVLREDGWTTQKSKQPIGATGGPYHIGARVYWQRWEGVVIAYLHDEDIGDLWKAMWLDGNETFDLEAEELQDARRKWERRNKQSEQGFSALPSARFASIAKFSVEGIETGIVMAKSYDSRARHGLFWPARVMHASEVNQLQSSQSRRSSSKNKLHVFFLAPYWNSTPENTSRPPLADSLSLGSSAFSSGPLIERDIVEISEDTIQPYPYQGENGLNIDELQVAFKFTGLPKSAFSRYLDSHRLALALKTYARQELTSSSTHSHEATAALTDTHALANETAKFPLALLHLPFQYILSNLPRTGEHQNSLAMGRSDDNIEPTIQLRSIMKSMEPPACWGQESKSSMSGSSPLNGQRITPALNAALTLPAAKRQLVTSVSNGNSSPSVADLQDVASEHLMQALTQSCSPESASSKLLDQLNDLLARIRHEVPTLKSLNLSQRRKRLLLFLRACLRVKGHGEDFICSEEFHVGVNSTALLTEWRKACEYIYRHASVVFSYSNFGNSTTYVISDSRCNEHITSNGCVERPVRLPAALKGARLAGQNTGRNVDFILSVGDEYMTLAEAKVIGMAHSSSYLKRMRAKCAAIEPGVSGAPLTDDSNFEGGEDTKGSRGSYTAAVAGVAAAIKGVDMIVGGQCVNAFCATRPPGHHAGRELHPMKAISNGFCILNNAACAALYATTPVSENGPGLKRVCVIDIDVHHGNGTQNILCETYDPRFLYISLHAGGAHINGHEADDEYEYRASIGSQDKQDAIFPGRCGDTSPHKGVLNIPLGARVKPQDMGMALASLVGPAVLKFAPDLIIVSTGFDAHKHDPLGMGGLTAEDFGHATDVICSMAKKCCSGRVLSILEGGYGVPCCRPQRNLFLPIPSTQDSNTQSTYEGSDDDEAGFGEKIPQPQLHQVEILDLGSDLPDEMDDQVPQTMHKTLNRCHAEGFVDCVREHVGSLAKSNDRSKL